jgi:L-aminopeptidase/D-esterase-like protein
MSEKPVPGADQAATDAGAAPPGAGMPVAWRTAPNGRRRARGLGLALPGVPGPFNAITDVAGVEVGVTTLIRGDGPCTPGRGPVRTGVTAILPRGRAGIATPVLAGTAMLNGNGELTGSWWIEETGRCELAVTITNTHSLGTARDATLKWAARSGRMSPGQDWGLPVAAETYDGFLNDINGFHIHDEHVFAALDGAESGPAPTGSVGGGTGMICYGFKGGTGGASRRVTAAGATHTVAVLVQANFGRTEELTILGVPVGIRLPADARAGATATGGAGSVIVVVATDAPLLPHQLKRLARRVPLGLARTGTIGHHSSGDVFLAFTTANAAATVPADGPIALAMLPEESLDPLFCAVVECVEEAVLDVLFANTDMTGIDDRTVRALPHAPVLAMLDAAGRLAG